MTIRFIHLRRRHPLWGTLESKGGVTVAYVRIDSEDVSTIRYSFSVCSPKDHYNKSIGRAVSTGRLKQDSKAFTFPKAEGVNIVEQIIKNHDSLLEAA